MATVTHVLINTTVLTHQVSLTLMVTIRKRRSLGTKRMIILNEKQSTLFPSTSDTSSALNVLQGLDLREVEPLTLKVLQVVEPFCDRVEVAGSFRRLRTVVNDLDIVVQSKPVSLCWVNMLKALRKEFKALTEKQGDKMATLYVPFACSKGQGHVQVDFYHAEAGNWGILLLVRTGSKEHNVKLCNLAIQKGLSLQYSVGLTNKKGQIVAGRTEEGVFQALGLPFVAPNEREV